jgi:hypothetical protein
MGLFIIHAVLWQLAPAQAAVPVGASSNTEQRGREVRQDAATSSAVLCYIVNDSQAMEQPRGEVIAAIISLRPDLAAAAVAGGAEESCIKMPFAGSSANLHSLLSHFVSVTGHLTKPACNFATLSTCTSTFSLKAPSP